MTNAINPNHRENLWHINDVSTRKVVADLGAERRTVVDVTIMAVAPDIVIDCAVLGPHRPDRSTVAVVPETETEIDIVAAEQVHRRRHPHHLLHHIIEANIDVHETQMHVVDVPHRPRHQLPRMTADIVRQWRDRVVAGTATDAHVHVPVLAMIVPQQRRKHVRLQTIEARVVLKADPCKP